MRFALELHNLFSTWHDEEDTKEEVDKPRLAVKKNSRNLSVFTDGSNVLLLIPGIINRAIVLVTQLLAQLNGSKALYMMWCRTIMRRTAALGNCTRMYKIGIISPPMMSR